VPISKKDSQSNNLVVLFIYIFETSQRCSASYMWESTYYSHMENTVIMSLIGSHKKKCYPATTPL